MERAARQNCKPLLGLTSYHCDDLIGRPQPIGDISEVDQSREITISLLGRLGQAFQVSDGVVLFDAFAGNTSRNAAGTQEIDSRIAYNQGGAPGIQLHAAVW